MTTVARKRAQRSGTTKSKGKPSPKPKPAVKASPGRPAAGSAKPAAQASAPPRQASAAPDLLEQVRALRQAVERSKQTAPDPWAYTAKARGWLQRTDQVLDRIGTSADAATTRKTLETLRAEIEADRDFREARKLF